MLARGVLLARTAMLLAVAPGTAAQPLDTRFGIAEGFRNAPVMAEMNAGWERLIVPWDQIQPDGPDDFGRLGITISDGQLQGELDRGVHIVGLLEVTPGSAQTKNSRSCSKWVIWRPSAPIRTSRSRSQGTRTGSTC